MSAKLPLPANPEAERAVLGSILLDPELLVSIDLEATDFYAERNAATYSAMRALWDAGQPVDFVLLMDELARQGKGDIVEPSHLTELMADTPTALYGPHYAGVVKRASIARQYVGMAQKLAEMAMKEEDADSIYSYIMEQNATISSGKKDDSAMLLWEDSFGYLERVLKAARIQEQERGGKWRWPWDSWNEILPAPQPGLLVYIAAATRTGKTVYGECIAEEWARAGRKVTFVHYELNHTLMVARRTSRHTGINVNAVLRLDELPASQQKLVRDAEERMSAWSGNINYLNAAGWTADQTIRELTRRHERGECEGFVIDYFQKISASPAQLRRFRNGNTDLLIQADNMEKLKNFAEQKELYPLVLGQLTKEAQEKPFSELRMTGMRGTQELADKVNVVLLLHRAILEAGMINNEGREIVPPGGLDTTVNIRVAKNTLGSEGIITQEMVPEMFNIF